MVKKSKAVEKSYLAHHAPYITIVAVVAVVAIVILILNFSKVSDEAVAGEAFRIARTASTTASSCSECERNLVNAQSELKECKNELSGCNNVCSAGGVLLEGETKFVQAKANEKQEVSLTYKDSFYSKFTVNGYATKKLKDGESEEISLLGVRITVLDSLYQDYAGGVHSATFCLKEYNS